jgi:anti-sigma factor RsiW
MGCRAIQRKLDRYAGGELGASARGVIAAHIRECDACRRELQQLHALRELFGSATVPPLPEDFAARVVAAARERTARRGDWAARPRRSAAERWRRLRVVAQTVAALAVGLAAGAYLGFDTWRAGPGRTPPGTADPLEGSAFRLFVDPGGDSLAQALLGWRANNDG